MVECPNCGREFDALGSHWSGSCGYPDIDDQTKEILTGLLLGDGYINKSENGNSRMIVKMCNKDFVNWVDSRLSWLSCGTTKRESAKEIADRFDTATEDSVVGPAYDVSTRRHPFFNELREWYSTGKKRFPSNLELTSESARMWYVCDGSLHPEGRAQIYSSNEKDRSAFLVSLFENHGFSPNMVEDVLYFSVDETPKFLEWVGKPVEGYEYKWQI